jgi:hypothetical protein
MVTQGGDEDDVVAAFERVGRVSYSNLLKFNARFFIFET